MQLDSQQKPGMAFYRERSVSSPPSGPRELYYSELTAGAWQTELVDSSGNQSQVGSAPSLAYDTSDKALIAYTDLSTSVLKYATQSDLGWAFSTVASLPAPYPVVVTSLVHTGSSPLVLFNSGFNESFASTPGSLWETEVVGAYSGYHPWNSLAIKADGLPAFIFTGGGAVPEPSTCVMALAGLACGGWHVFKGRRRRKASGISLSLLVLLLATCSNMSGTAHAQLTLDWVTVGDPGNTADTTGYGAVADSFNIMKYDVTIQNYTDFLNAVAATDTYSLYNASMVTTTHISGSRGISRAGSPGSYTYDVFGSGALPITYVSWFDGTRFANWMQNGQLTGADGAASTETGAYTLGGGTSGNAMAVNAGAQYYVPTENQWYKAAYYKGGGANAGYWPYGTQSDSTPGTTVGSTPNQANYKRSLGISGAPLTDVGAFAASASAYGLFDMSGNVRQWNDLDGTAGSSRGFRGGYWGTFSELDLSSSARTTNIPSVENSNMGFRLAAPAAVPEPSTCASLLAGLACAGYSLFRRRRAR